MLSNRFSFHALKLTCSGDGSASLSGGEGSRFESWLDRLFCHSFLLLFVDVKFGDELGSNWWSGDLAAAECRNTSLHPSLFD